MGEPGGSGLVEMLGQCWHSRDRNSRLVPLVLPVAVAGVKGRDRSGVVI